MVPSTRPLLLGLAALLVVVSPASPVAAAPDAVQRPSVVAVAGSGISALVTVGRGRAWKVQFRDKRGVVLQSVRRGAVSVVTPRGRLTATKIASVSKSTVVLATSDPAVNVTVSVRRHRRGLALSAVASGDVDEVAIDLDTSGSERYLGLGERSAAVDHRGRTVLNRVLDGPYTPDQVGIIRSYVPPPGFSERQDATYFPMPWVLSTSGYGLLLTNDEDSIFELDTKEHRGVNRLRVAASRLDLVVLAGRTPRQVLRRFTEVIGRQPATGTPMTEGVWWQPAGDAVAQLDAQQTAGVPLSVAQTYTHYLPCADEQTERERALTAAAHERGVGVTTYVNPMVCTSHPAYDEGVAAGAFTKGSDGQPLTYRYSTASNFTVSQIDFSSAAGRAFFARVLGRVVADGYDGWMEDFGEYTPDSAVSADGSPGATMHNRYVEQYHRAAGDYAAATPRPLLRFNRSGWTDAVRESAIVWGGDPTVTWGFDGLSSSVTQGLTMGLSGVSVWGPDIGGFFQWLGAKPDAELLNRWIQYGAFTGVMRLQSGGINLSGEPRVMVTDPQVAPVWRDYSQLRTRLYPYIAAAQADYRRTGLPLMRHLSLVDPVDAKALTTDDAYLFGDSLLVAPVTEPGATKRSVHLPRGRWVDVTRAWQRSASGELRWRAARVHTGRSDLRLRAPSRKIPLLQRAGSVVPMLPTSVDSLSEYDRSARSLAAAAGRRTLVAVPSPGRWQGALGPGEKVASVVDRTTWTLTASKRRTYEVQASLSALPASFRPCRVEAGQRRVKFRFSAKRRSLSFVARAGGARSLVVTACR